MRANRNIVFIGPLLFSLVFGGCAAETGGDAAEQPSSAEPSPEEATDEIQGAFGAATLSCNQGPHHKQDGGARHRAIAEYIAAEMRKNAPIAVRDLAVLLANPQTRVTGLGLFGNRVRAGADWDHKPKLRDQFGMSLDYPDTLYADLPEGRRELFYDVWSNVHYGFVGTAAGISPTELQTAANISDGVTGVNDEADRITIGLGIEIARKHAVAAITGSLLEREVASIVPSLLKADCYHVRNVPEVANVAVECFVFNDGYRDMAGPSAAVQLRGERQACIPDGSSTGLCRKWFGRCRTRDTQEPVRFTAFNTGFGELTPATDALYPGYYKICAPDGSEAGACREGFGQGLAEKGRVVGCQLYDDDRLRETGYVDWISVGTGSKSVCDGIAQGTLPKPCRKWFSCEVRPLAATTGLGDARRPTTPPRSTAADDAKPPARPAAWPPPTSESTPSRNGCVYVQYCDHPNHAAGTVCRTLPGCSISSATSTECARDAEAVCGTRVIRPRWLCDVGSKDCRSVP
ncbi:MAG: polymorphic toxin type 44 domain-containing protein [Polyangiales bacterium]